MSGTAMFKSHRSDYIRLTGALEVKGNASQDLLRTQVTPLWLYGIKINSTSYLSDWCLNFFLRVTMGTAQNTL